MKSPYLETSEIINAPFDAVSELRIIARDGLGLGAVDRDKLRAAADELESIQRAFMLVHMQLAECNAARIATNDKLISVLKQIEHPGYRVTLGPL